MFVVADAVVVVVVEVPGPAIVCGNSKHGAEEAKGSVGNRVNREEERGQVVAQWALQYGLKGMHGVLGKRARLLELVVDAVHVIPQVRDVVKPSVGPVEPVLGLGGGEEGQAEGLVQAKCHNDRRRYMLAQREIERSREVEREKV